MGLTTDRNGHGLKPRTDIQWKFAMRSHLDSRLKQHRDNFELWKTGFLNPTEPDEQERAAIMRELEATIDELELMEEFLNG